MRISDWSSDVCSSDLDTRRGGVGYEVVLPRARSGMDCSRARQLDERVDFGDAVFHRLEGADRLAEGAPGQCIVACGFEQLFGPAGLFVRGRSEEHTSELQSLMRISYVVYCLKNKYHHDLCQS